MRNFNYDIPTKILFGKNKVEEMMPEIKTFGSRLLLAYGGGSIKKNGLYDTLVTLFKKNDIFVVELSGIQPNPRISSVREGVRLCRAHKIDLILAVGGGSVIDACKAIAAGVNYKGDAWDFMIGKAQVENPLPIGTILTLAATGSEMNGGAVISNDETLDKRPMGHPSLRPKFSVLDPTYTFSVNKWQTGAGVTDIMSHIFELYYTTDKGVFVPDAMAEALMKTCLQYGLVAIDEPENYEARANLMWAGTLALNGMLSFGKLPGDWATHMIEHEISAIYDVTHGAGLAIIFPVWMEYVLDADNAWRFAQMARNVWGVSEKDDLTAARQGIEAVRDFFSRLGMPSRLSDLNIDGTHIAVMAKKACVYGDLGNIKKLKIDDVRSILEGAL
ncbi:iron-containing alcohol dehydrogenase [Geofilum rubicundum]|uniref:NADH-dependent butanol dehydrogenase A n=1 Tax=Geofilum rubicundum JCM 15548 TaxID=1236989 RepID=A0A0E9LYV9_9BACT|nr:iron-containing alcohol dehydrogenase [Geofilum rubicundum]GAO30326.1 NADH-dependent butanol dehydrogenase A [Geofilum rubicundum JCM 15548]